MSEHSEKFEFTYSAAQQAEINSIRKKYLTDAPAEEVDKMEQLRRLDADVTKRAMIPSLTLGILGTLVMGLGMSLVMTDLKGLLGAYADQALLIGILIGFVGMAGCICAYPLYSCILARQRKKIAPQILKLAEELTR